MDTLTKQIKVGKINMRHFAKEMSQERFNYHFGNMELVQL